MLKELALLVALLAFVTDARPYLKEEVNTNIMCSVQFISTLKLENEADTAEMNDNDVEMKDVNGDDEKRLEGKNYSVFHPS